MLSGKENFNGSDYAVMLTYIIRTELVGFMTTELISQLASQSKILITVSSFYSYVLTNISFFI